MRLASVGMWSMMVLGSAQDGGLPQFGARTPLDQAARSGAIPRRYSSCVAVVADDGRCLLLDIGPDIKAHEEVLLGHPAMERRTDGGPIDGAVITHAHIGHYAGLIHLGREVQAADALPCWVTSATGHFLRAEAPWRLAIEQGHIEINELQPPASFSPWADLEVSLLPVPHRHEASDTVAISVNGSALYLPDIDSWDEWPVAGEVIARHSTALLDATFWSAGELPHRDISEIKHPLVPDTLRRFEHLADGTRLILTHLNHTNPVCDPGSAEHAAVIDAGFEVALEGLTFAIQPRL
jgi:pyrroloquinoline quinone biosynthesis protein B